MSDAHVLLSQVYLTLNGDNAPEEMSHDLLEVTVESTLHLPDVATVILNDSGLRWIDADILRPGVSLTIQTRAGKDSKPVFEGEIVELEPDFRAATHRLIVRAFDLLHRLSHGRHVRTFQNVNDGDLVRTLAQDVGLQAKVGPTPQTHPYVLQSNETNLEFLRRRAAALGYLLFVRGKTLHCEEANSTGHPIELEWGKTLSDFHPRLATTEQVTSVTVRGWDPQKKQSIVGKATRGRDMPRVGQVQSDSGGEEVKKAFGIDAEGLVTNSPIATQAAADSLAQSIADRLAGRYIEAEGICSGNPAIIAGVAIDLKAVGKRFGGTYRVTRATHVYNAREGYSTHFSVSGQTASTLLSLLSTQSHRSPAGGLANGIVTDNQDPEGLGRVKVKFPWLSDDHASFWARLAVPGGGAQRGMEYLPEVNDEVLVGFEHGDMQQPYILGGLWNGVDLPPKKTDQVVQGGKVQQRIIQSRTGHTIILDDDDGGGGISIVDSQGNKIVIDSQNNTMSLTVRGDFSLKADGKIDISGNGITLDAGDEAAEVTGSGVTLNGQTREVQVRGIGATIDGGGGGVTVSGSMINLN
jgi:phage protein D